MCRVCGMERFLHPSEVRAEVSACLLCKGLPFAGLRQVFSAWYGNRWVAQQVLGWSAQQVRGGLLHVTGE